MLDYLRVHAYPLGTFLFFVSWIIIYHYRSDLRQKMMFASVFGGVSSLITSCLFLSDYWSPPSFFSDKPAFLPEDFFWGFALTGLIATVYDFIFKKRNVFGEVKQKKMFYLLFLLCPLGIIVLMNIYKLNSMVVCIIILFLIGILIMLLRRDLIKPALFSILFIFFYATACYYILFNLFAPDFWKNYWQLAGTKMGLTVFGNIPVLEILFYCGFGAAGSVMFEFATGAKKINLDS